MKYPRTVYIHSCANHKPHRYIENYDNFIGNRVIISEKLDGSNCSLDRNNLHSRSHNGPPTHDSFSKIKEWHSWMRWKIPENIQIFAEYCFAVHSYKYNTLPHFLFVFGVLEIESDFWWDWDKITTFCLENEFHHVPVLEDFIPESEEELENRVLELCAEKSLYGEKREGVVIRTATGYNNEDFHSHLMKYVNHAFKESIGDEHWTEKPVIKQFIF